MTGDEGEAERGRAELDQLEAAAVGLREASGEWQAAAVRGPVVAGRSNSVATRSRLMPGPSSSIVTLSSCTRIATVPRP